MAKTRGCRYVDKLVNTILLSDTVRSAELVYELSKRDKERCTSDMLEIVIKKHLFFYQEEPDWMFIVGKLLEGYRFHAARVVTLYVSDDALRSQLIVMRLMRLREFNPSIRTPASN